MFFTRYLGKGNACQVIMSSYSFVHGFCVPFFWFAVYVHILVYSHFVLSSYSYAFSYIVSLYVLTS